MKIRLFSMDLRMVRICQRRRLEHTQATMNSLL